MALKIEKFQSPGKRNGLRATALVAAGETLYTAKPFAYVVNESHYGRVCEFCLLETSSLLRCARCKFAKYCDKQCQINAWPDHKLECRCLQKFDIDKTIHLVRFVGRIILKRLQKKPCPSEELYSVPELVSNYFKDENFEMVFISGWYAERIRLYLTSGMPDPSKLPNNQILAEHFCKVLCNRSTVSNESNEDVAQGLYPSLSLVNHSCDPNCGLGGIIMLSYLKAIREVQAGEEITICYLGPAPIPTRDRQMELMQTYCFKCDCHLCEADESVLASDGESSVESTDSSEDDGTSRKL